jgi:serine phosphatase RsbU (regulator of sigma subunit)
VNEPSVRTAGSSRLVLDLRTPNHPDQDQIESPALLELSLALSGALTTVDVAHATRRWAARRLGAAFTVLSLLEEAEGSDPHSEHRRLRLSGHGIDPAADAARLDLDAASPMASTVVLREPLLLQGLEGVDLDYLSASPLTGGRSGAAAGVVLHLPLFGSASPAEPNSMPAQTSAATASRHTERFAQKVVLGVLTIGWRADTALPLDDAARATFDAISAHTAQALGRAFQYEQQHTVAQTLQSAALPRHLPQPDGWRLAARYLPATRHLVVGGDWYDAFPLPGGRLAMVVGDATGHGLDAARMMSSLRNALRAYAVLGDGPAATLERLDTLLEVTAPDALATVVCLELSPDEGEVVWAVAGHPPPLLVGLSTSKEASFVAPVDEDVDPPLGARLATPGGPDAPRRHERRLRLAPGETLLLYTDGLIERRDHDVTKGLAKLRSAALITAGEAPEVQADSVIGTLIEATGPADDVCVLALSRDP